MKYLHVFVQPCTYDVTAGRFIDEGVGFEAWEQVDGDKVVGFVDAKGVALAVPSGASVSYMDRAEQDAPGPIAA